MQTETQFSAQPVVAQRAFAYYGYYVALKLHFSTSKYNFIEQKGKVKSSYDAYSVRNDRYFFEKAATLYDTEKFIDKCLCEVKLSTNFHIKDIMRLDNESRYFKRKGYLEAFEQSLSKEISSVILPHCLKNKISKQKFVENDLGIRMLLQGKLTEETYLALQKAYYNDDSRHEGDPLLIKTQFFLKKYEPFIAWAMPPKETLLEIFDSQLDIVT